MSVVIFVFFSGRGLCDELITRPGESYGLWCVVVCDLETNKQKTFNLNINVIYTDDCDGMKFIVNYSFQEH